MTFEEQLKELSTASYWNNYYRGYEGEGLAEQKQKSDQEYEWYRTFEDVKTFLVAHLPSPASHCKLLHLGNGTSVRHLLTPPDCSTVKCIRRVLSDSDAFDESERVERWQPVTK